MAALDIKIREKSTGVFTVVLTGPIDSATHPFFDEGINKILNTATHAIALDMKGVNYVSSMGIGSIFKVRKFAKENNVHLVIVNLQPQVKKVFDTVQAMPPEAIFSSIAELDEYLKDIQNKAKGN